MSNPGEEQQTVDDDNGGAVTVLMHHRGTGKFAALTNKDIAHINNSVTSDDVKKKLGVLLKAGS